MQAWAPISVSAVSSATGNLTALFPATCTVISSPGTTPGSLRRRQTAGVLTRCEVFTSDAAGGTIEIWDVDGLWEGANNNVSTGTTLTNSYLTAKQALGEARMIWTQAFKGDSGSRAAIFTAHCPFSRGLAARYINSGGTSVTLSIVADGGFMKIEIAGA